MIAHRWTVSGPNRELLARLIGRPCGKRSAAGTSTRFVALGGEIAWLTVADAVAIHDDQLTRFGGAPGIKSLALLESAMAAPLNHHAYDDEKDIVQLGAILTHALVKNHAFVDGNKRTAAVALLEFLYLNRVWIDLPDTSREQPLADLVERPAGSAITAREFAEAVRPSVARF